MLPPIGNELFSHRSKEQITLPRFSCHVNFKVDMGTAKNGGQEQTLEDRLRSGDNSGYFPAFEKHHTLRGKREKLCSGAPSFGGGAPQGAGELERRQSPLPALRATFPKREGFRFCPSPRGWKAEGQGEVATLQLLQPPHFVFRRRPGRSTDTPWRSRKNQLTFSTGLVRPLRLLGFEPITASHCACVTLYLPR